MHMIHILSASTSANTSLLQAAAPRGGKWSCPRATEIRCWSVLNLAGLIRSHASWTVTSFHYPYKAVLVTEALASHLIGINIRSTTCQLWISRNRQHDNFHAEHSFLSPWSSKFRDNPQKIHVYRYMLCR